MSEIGTRLYFGGMEGLDPDAADYAAGDEDVEFEPFSEESDAEEDAVYENPQTGARGNKRAHSPSSQAAQPTKRPRIHGGRAAISKPITADYDSDDGRIITLKSQGYSDQHVVQKLQEEGRVRYIPKTVASRWARLKQMLEEKENAKLDDELSDWHVGEDGELNESMKIVQEKLDYEIQKLKAKYWKDVSAKLTDRLQRKKYTAKACKERFTGLLDGTALKAIELDSDPEGRAELRATRIAEAKRIRAVAADKAKRLRAEKEEQHRLVEAAREAAWNAQQMKKEDRKAEKAEIQRIKEQKQRDREERRAAIKQQEDKARAERHAKSKQRKIEQLLIRKLGGNARMPKLKKTRVAVSDSEDDEDMSDLADDEGSAKKKSAKRTKARVTAETLLNPRSIMTDSELGALLHERGLPRRGNDESHPQVVARLAAADKELTCKEIDELLRPLFVCVKGTLGDKVVRLQEADAKGSAAGDDGVTAADLEFKKGYEGYAGEFAGLIGDEEGEYDE